MPRVTYGVTVSVPPRTGAAAGAAAPSSSRGTVRTYCSIVCFPNKSEIPQPAASSSARGAIQRGTLITDARTDSLLRGLTTLQNAAGVTVEPLGEPREVLRRLGEVAQ